MKKKLIITSIIIIIIFTGLLYILTQPLQKPMNCAMPVTIPETVELESISSSDYNKVTINWKKAALATDYYIYYRKTGTKKWKKLAKVNNTTFTYTHTTLQLFHKKISYRAF